MKNEKLKSGVRRALCIVHCALCIGAPAAQLINDGKLQSALNANARAITNLAYLTDTNGSVITGDPSIELTNFVVLRSRGNDSTAALNDASKPAATITNALRLLTTTAQTLTNGLIFIPPGEIIVHPDTSIGSLVTNQSVTVVAWGAKLTNGLCAYFQITNENETLHIIGGKWDSGSGLSGAAAFNIGKNATNSLLLIEHISPSVSGHDWIIRNPGSALTAMATVILNDVDVTIQPGADIIYVPVASHTNSMFDIRNSRITTYEPGTLPIIKVAGNAQWRLANTTFIIKTNSAIVVGAAGACDVKISNCHLDYDPILTNIIAIKALSGATVTMQTPFALDAQITNDGTCIVTNTWGFMAQDTIVGNGIGLTNLNATELRSGTVADAILSTNVGTTFTTSERLGNWFSAIGRSGTVNTSVTTNLSMLFLGDSWVQDDIAGSLMPREMTNCFGYGGPGYVSAGTNSLYNNTPPLVQRGVTGVWTNVFLATNSPNQNYMESAANGATLSITGICSSISILYLQSPGSGTFNFSVDGGAAVVVDSSSATTQLAVTNAAGVSASTVHRITIANVSGTIQICAVWMENLVAGYPYCTVNNFARGGNSVTNYSESDSNSLVTAIRVVKPLVSVVVLGTNDRLQNRTASDYKTGLFNICQRIWAASSNSDIILCTPPEIAGGGSLMEDYRTAIKELAQTNRIAVCDMAGIFGPYNTATNRWTWLNAYHAGTPGYYQFVAELMSMLKVPRIRILELTGLNNLAATYVTGGNVTANNKLVCSTFEYYSGGQYTFNSGHRIRFGSTDASPAWVDNGSAMELVGGAGGKTNSLIVDGSITTSTITLTNAPTYRATNAAPAGFVIGVTLPSGWLRVTNDVGAMKLVPYFDP